MTENKYHRDITLKHKFFKTQKHFFNNSDLVTLDSPSFEINHNYIKTEMYKIFD